MTERPSIDSFTQPPQASGADAPSVSDTGASLAQKPATAKRVRKPRPTFDDGALTRTFKFPSKSYPRSSYYVTSTEIIIRIKKARKKWKLIVPKKRVVSYRTNRWFAKPRWIAIELTYTQAVKLGLAEARATPNAPPETSTSNMVPLVQPDLGSVDVANAGPASVVPPHPISHAVETEVEADLHCELADQIDDFGDHDSADGMQLATDDSDDEIGDSYVDDESECDFDHAGAREAKDPPPVQPLLLLPPPVRTEAEMAQHTAVARSEPHEPRLIPRAARPAPIEKASRHKFRRGVAALAAAVIGFSVWAALDTTPLNHGPPLSLGPECARGEAAAPCASMIVTGSIAPTARVPQTPAAAADDSARLAPPPPEPQAEAAPIEQTTAALMSPPTVHDITPEPAVPESAGPEAMAAALLGRDLALPLSPPVITVSAAPQQPAETVRVACETLSAAGRDIPINFDYARSQLDPAAAAALDAFAEKLRACPDSKVTIEGHTDSDGRANNNRSLSLRRAQFVQKHLVAAGVEPERLSAIGFGQTRPAVPNVSQQNKRNNRRAVLVVTTQR